MKLVKQLVCILAVAAAAWAQNSNTTDFASAKFVAPSVQKIRPPCEHRGTFFSVGIGFSYAGVVYEDDKYNYSSGTSFNGNWVSSYNEGPRKKWDYDSFEFPTIDIRLGRSFANFFSIYTLLSAGAYSGQVEYTYEKIGLTKYRDANGGIAEEATVISEAEAKEYGGMYARFSLGLGFAIYPFRNRESPLNGLYVGFASGVDSWTARLDGDYDSFDKAGIFTRYEIGKDWWVSETWSIGVGLVFTNVSNFIEDYDGTDSGHVRILSLLFRITRG